MGGGGGERGVLVISSYLQRRGRLLAAGAGGCRPPWRGEREPGAPKLTAEVAWPTPPACSWLQEARLLAAACWRGLEEKS